MVGVLTKCIADRHAVGVEAVRADFRLADNPATEVVQEVHGAFGIPLADTPANDRLLRPGHADENVLIALGVDLMALDVLLLLAEEAPQLVKLKALGAHANHDAGRAVPCSPCRHAEPGWRGCHG